MRRDLLLQHIGASPTPVATSDATAALGIPANPEANAAVDVLLELSPDVSTVSGGWVAAADTRERRILGALRAFAEAHPHRRIFRAAAALGDLPAGDQMTEPLLRDLLSRTGEFRLLANAMIKRES